jgi:hypothetical protein
MGQKLVIIEIESGFVWHPIFDEPKAHPENGMLG